MAYQPLRMSRTSSTQTTSPVLEKPHSAFVDKKKSWGALTEITQLDDLTVGCKKHIGRFDVWEIKLKCTHLWKFCR